MRTKVMTPEQEAAEEIREKAARIARNRAEGGHTSECECGHVEYDTNAFVCSNRHGCLCAEREEEAEAIADLILSIPLPEAKSDRRDAALAKATEALKFYARRIQFGDGIPAQAALAAIESALKGDVPS